MRGSAGSARRRLLGSCAALALTLLAGTEARAVELRRITGPAPDDATLEKTVMNRISGRPGLDVSGIEAEVRDAALTLSGTVADLHTKREVERLAAAIRGLLSLENRMRVVRKDVPDALLQQEAKRAIELIPRLRSFRLSISATDAAVLLEGEVPLARDRLGAEEAAARVAGVVAIDNRIRIAPVSTDPKLIRTRLVRLLTNKLIFGGVEGLLVEVGEGGEVSMQGRVVTHADRMRAERIAYGLQGVTTVDNQLLVRTVRQPQ